jgi:hypothetical protein
MTCRELLDRFRRELERDELDLEALRKIFRKCGYSFALEASRAFARKVVQVEVSRGWALYRGSKLAGRDAAAAYGRAVEMIWRLWDWFEMECGPLADIAAYVAEAASKYGWPRWPFLALPAAAAEERGCTLPDAVAEALGPDEYARLEAFLEEGEGVVELEKGLKIALVRDGRYIGIVV